MELTIEHALQQGIAAHKEGKLQDAEKLYRTILQSQPTHPDANHNLGVLAVSVGKVQAAIPFFKVALETNSEHVQFWLSYIDALIKLDHLDEAKRVLKQAKKQGVDRKRLNALETRLKLTTEVNTIKKNSRKKHVEAKRNKKNQKQLTSSASAPSAELSNLLELYQKRQYVDAERLAIFLTEKFPKNQFAWKVLGAVLKQTGKIDGSLVAMKKSVYLGPQDAEAHNNLGITLREQGRLDEAEVSYTKAILLTANLAEAYHNLGNTLTELDRLNEAGKSYTRAIALNADYAEAHNNLGNTLKELDRLDEAEASYTQAITLKVNYAEAHNNLGNTLKELGRLNEAEASYTQAIAFKTDFAEAHSNLGNTLKEIGKLNEAEVSYKQAITLQPDFAEANYNLGKVLQMRDRLEEAQASYTQAIAFKPDFAEAHNNLGNTLQELGRLNQAEASYTQAISLNPFFAKARSNLGATLQVVGRLREAEASCRKAIALNPDYAKSHNNLAITLQELGRLDEAEASCRRAIELKSNYAEAHSNLGNILKELGRLDESEANHSQAIAFRHDFAEARSNRLFLNASMRFETTSYLNDALEFSKVIARKIRSPFLHWTYSRCPKSLRVGFVSGDFKAHPVGYFLEGLLVQLQSSTIELFAYPTNNSSDEITERMKPLFHSWVPLLGKSDKEAAHLIHRDGVHILIDLSGHTAKNRLPVFAWKPAPIQISWLGYFASSGLLEIDYIVGDPFVTPEKEAHHFTEKIWQLPESYLCFTIPDHDVEVSRLPALSNGFITFGCFNKLYKMTDEVVLTRSRILKEVPHSKLFLKDKQLDSQLARNRVLSLFATHGITADRLLLEGRSSREEYLSCYNRVDIALSPFPYGGGTTSVEGLWMGVPVIAKKGSYFLSHLGESIAHNTRLSDWVAASTDDYIIKAISFSSDLEALDTLRTGLRKQLLKTPLFDLRRFSQHFEQALWKMRNSIDLK